jgi:hypothetical protein
MTEHTLNEWWEHTDFPQMEKITKLRYYWFHEDEGYQEFVDVCDNWWYSLSKKDKELVYNDYTED